MVLPLSLHQPRRLTVLVMAAGQGSRFKRSGGLVHKLQALLQSKPLLQHVLDTVAQTGLHCHVVHPQGLETAGMGDSIAIGVRATSQSEGWLIFPADMPLVQPSTVLAVAQALSSSSSVDAVVPYWSEQAGHPVAFSARCRNALQAISGDQGARSVLKALRSLGTVQHLAVNDPGILHDVDTVDDLHRAAAQMPAQAEHTTPAGSVNAL